MLLCYDTAGVYNWFGLASNAAGTTLLGGAFGGPVLLSTDASNWNQPTSLPAGQWRTAASSASGDSMIAAMYQGYLYYTSNGGATWEAR